MQEGVINARIGRAERCGKDQDCFISAKKKGGGAGLRRAQTAPSGGDVEGAVTTYPQIQMIPHGQPERFD